MSLIVDLVIRTPFAGCEEHFAEAVAVREQSEQHWSGGAGKGGDVRPSSSLNEVMMDRGGEMCERLITEHGWSEPDFRHAARRLEATGDPDLRTLAQHVRAWEMFANEKEETQMANAAESMTRQLIAGLGEAYLREQRTPISNADSKRQHPRQTAWTPYPTGAKPVAEDVDPDRAARGARSASFSQRLRSLAQEVAGMAKLSSNARQRARLLQRSEELERMAVRQYEREGESEVVPSGDPSEPNNVMSKLAADMRDEAGAARAQPDDSFNSYDDWSDKPGADEQIADDVQDQQDDTLQLDREDVPQGLPPRPGRRVDEDNLGDAALYTDDVPGRRKNTATHLALPKGSAYRGKPAGRYSAFSGKESLRESSDLDLTAEIIEDQKLNWYGSHGSF